jgi:hypothetical protein
MDELGIGSRIKHPEFGVGVVINVKPKTYIAVFTERGKIEVAKAYQHLEVIDAQPTPDDQVSFADMERIFTNIIRKYSDMQETVPMHGKWIGGKVVLYPHNPSQKPKEIPMDVFFNKIVMTRDRLRVMEQRINANDKLSEEDKVNLQQYLTRIYGSLTTFNVLFKDEEDHFVGEKGSKD